MFRALLGVVVGRLPLPDNFIDESVFPENPIKHHFDVMTGVPVAVIEERPSRLQHTGELLTTWSHEVDVSLCRCVPVIKGPLFLCLAPKYLVIPVRIKWWVYVDQIHALISGEATEAALLGERPLCNAQNWKSVTCEREEPVETSTHY